jgi:hypothetical protein
MGTLVAAWTIVLVASCSGSNGGNVSVNDAGDQDGTVASCGSPGNACCNGTACNAGLVCAANVCAQPQEGAASFDGSGDETASSDANDALDSTGTLDTHDIADADVDAGGILDAESGPVADASDAPADSVGEGDGTTDHACDGSACNGSCVDLNADDANCGACGYACVHGRHCAAARCTPAWLPMNGVGAPTPRSTPGAAIAGQLIISGGVVNCTGASAPSLATAASYDPGADAWTTLPNLNSARSQQTVVSTGSKIYTFGGLGDCINGSVPLGSLESWTPGATAWSLVSGANPPSARYAHESAWTGSKLLVYGGSNGSSPYVATGAVFDPNANTWADASCPLVNCTRNDGAIILDQGYVRIWGGAGGAAPNGLEYSVSNGTWSTWVSPGTFPLGYSNPVDDGRRLYLPTGGCTSNLDIVLYDRQTQTSSTDTPPSPAGLSAGGSIAWTGAEVVLWSGSCASGISNVGGRYQPPAP